MIEVPSFMFNLWGFTKIWLLRFTAISCRVLPFSPAQKYQNNWQTSTFMARCSPFPFWRGWTKVSLIKLVFGNLFDRKNLYEFQGNINPSEGGFHQTEKNKLIYQRDGKNVRSGHINKFVHSYKESMHWWPQ